MMAKMPDSAMSSSDTKHTLILMPSGRRGEIEDGITLLDAAQELGVTLESICGGRQTCGKCVVEPGFGSFPKHGIRSRPEHVSAVEQSEIECAREHQLHSPSQRLGCAARLQGDVLVYVPEASMARKLAVRKGTGDIQLEVEPALRLAYIETQPARLGGPSSEERLVSALDEQWSLNQVDVDPVLLPRLEDALTDGTATVTVWKDKEIVRIEPGYRDGVYGLAVDIGSTTVAAHLTDLRTGHLLASKGTMNPQVRYGEDLMSRISYAMGEPHGTERMRRAVVRTINELAVDCAGQAGISAGEICELVLVGNTVMHHVALGLNPSELGRAPFSLTVRGSLDAQARDFGFDELHQGAKLYVPPLIAGHVGADCAAVLLSQHALRDDSTTLIVDVGTNAEIILMAAGRILVASSPTGPALEGAQIEFGQRAAVGAVERVRIDPEAGVVRYRVVSDERWSDQLGEGEGLRPTGICGSGILEVVGELFAAGWLDSTGRLSPDLNVPGGLLRPTGRNSELILVPAAESASGREIVVTQNDIRAVQLAKAALHAGVRLLMDHMQVENLDRIRLAGTFGSYIDPIYALMIGLVPDCDAASVRSVGNAAGDGARMILINSHQRKELERLLERVEYVETALESRFQDHFVAAMDIPHGLDRYPRFLESSPDVAARIEPHLTRPQNVSPRQRPRRRKRRSPGP